MDAGLDLLQGEGGVDEKLDADVGSRMLMDISVALEEMQPRIHVLPLLPSWTQRRDSCAPGDCDGFWGAVSAGL